MKIHKNEIPENTALSQTNTSGRHSFQVIAVLIFELKSPTFQQTGPAWLKTLGAIHLGKFRDQTVFSRPLFDEPEL